MSDSESNSTPRATPSTSTSDHDGPQAPAPDSIPAYFAPLSLRLVLTGLGLGVLIGASATLGSGFFFNSSSQNTVGPQFYIYLFSWGFFHLMEFVVTAHWNPTRLMKDSFLLQNGWNYHAAHVGGMLEFLIEAYFFPSLSTLRTVNYLGFALVITGQLLRSLAMIQAANNFSHQVASRKRQDHILVKEGLYAIVRHPSYSGFFTWAVGTQILLGNPLGVAVFVLVLWRFFHSRIQSEEQYLIDFFAKEYTDYKKRVWSGIPFVP